MKTLQKDLYWKEAIRGRKKEILIVALVLVLFGAEYIYVKIHPAEAPSQQPTSLDEEARNTQTQPAANFAVDESLTSGWKIYKNDLGFQFYYPRPGIPKTSTDAKEYIELPITQGTNLTNKTAEIVLMPGPCRPLQADQTFPGATMTGNKLIFAQEKGIIDWGGQIYDLTRFVTYHNNSCVGLLFTLRYNRTRSGDQTPSFNEDKEAAVFDQIMSTFSFKK